MYSLMCTDIHTYIHTPRKQGSLTLTTSNTFADEDARDFRMRRGACEGDDIVFSVDNPLLFSELSGSTSHSQLSSVICGRNEAQVMKR